MELQAPETQSISELFAEIKEEMVQGREAVQTLKSLITEFFLKFEEKNLEFEAPPLDLVLQQDNGNFVLEEDGIQNENVHGLLFTAGISGIPEKNESEIEFLVEGVKPHLAPDKPPEIFLFKIGEREDFLPLKRMTPFQQLHLPKLKEKLDDCLRVDKTLKVYREWKRYKKRRRKNQL